MSEWFAIVLLAVVQGATEFLPVSSSGHLSLGHALLGAGEDPPILVDIVLHVGTLVAVVGVYRRDVAKIVSHLVAALRGPNKAQTLRSDPWAWQGILVVVATVATTAIALTLKDAVETLLRGPAIVGAMLLVTGAVLWSSRRVQARKAEDEPVEPAQGLTWKAGVIIGVLQGLAVTPGISRSGLTITGALHLGVPGEVAARFSFLLSIPAILGALVLKLGELDSIGAVHWPRLLVGAAVAAIVGWACLVLLLKLLNRARFHHFAWYCWGLGATAIVWSLLA